MLDKCFLNARVRIEKAENEMSPDDPRWEDFWEVEIPRQIYCLRKLYRSNIIEWPPGLMAKDPQADEISRLKAITEKLNAMNERI